MPNAELPFILSAANDQPRRSDKEVFDPAVAVAFTKFHRGVARSARHRYLAASAHFLRGTGGVILGLTFLAFSGGLFLARVSFTAAEHPITVGLSAPEMIYQRPPAAESTAVLEQHDSAAPLAESVAAVAEYRRAPSLDERPTQVTAQQPTAAVEQAITAGNLTPNTLPEATANFAAAMRLNAIGGSPDSGGTSDITSGFAAEELPSVPEPAAGPTIAIGLAILLGLARIIRGSHKVP
jgi:hypothetical protein